MLGNRQRLSVMNMGAWHTKSYMPQLYIIYIVGEKIELKFFLFIIAIRTYKIISRSLLLSLPSPGPFSKNYTQEKTL